MPKIIPITRAASSIKPPLKKSELVEALAIREHSNILKRNAEIDAEIETLQASIYTEAHLALIRSTGKPCREYNGNLFTAGLKPEHDGCLGFNWDGKRQKWRISLYGVPGKPDIDLSAIAVRYGGGGHKQACGFECLALPFPLSA